VFYLCLSYFFVLMILPSPLPTCFPYTTLFRSAGVRPGAGTGRAGAPVAVALSPVTLSPVALSPVSVAAAVEHVVGPPRWGLLARSEEHTSELQSRENLVCRLLLEKKKKTSRNN